MNEQNNNLNVGAPQPQQPIQPTSTPDATVAETPVTQEAVVAQPVATSTPVVQETPVSTPVVENTVVTQTEVNVPTEPVVHTEPASATVVQEVSQVQETPTPVPVNTAVQQTDIVAQEPLNPLANEPVTTVQEVPVQQGVTTQQVETQPTNNLNNGVFSPSTPLQPVVPNNGAIDTSNVGFVAASAPPKKKKNKPLIITIILGIIIGLAALGYFVIYPFIVNQFFSDPRKVYETVIRTAFKGLEDNVTEVVHDKAIMDLQFSFDSNIPTIQSYGGYKYGLNIGLDPVNKLLQAGFTVLDKNNVGHNMNAYIKDGKQYLRFSSKRELIYAGEASLSDLLGETEADYSEIFSTIEQTNTEDINYLVNKLSDLLVTSIDESKLSKEDASIKVNGNTLKVTNNKYQVDAELFEKTMKHILQGLNKDKKVVKILAESFGVEEKKVEETITSLISSTSMDEGTDKKLVYTLSIYTTKGLKPDVIGYGIKNNQDDSTFHYYTTENYFEVRGYIVDKDEETNRETENTIDIIGETSGGKTNVSISYNDTELITLNIKEWSDTKKDFTYELKLAENSTINGKILIEKVVKEKKITNSIDFSLEMGEQFISFSIDLSEDWGSEIANINTTEAVTMTDDQIEEQFNLFIQGLADTPIGELFKTVSGDITPEIPEYYNDTDQMITIE